MERRFLPRACYRFENTEGTRGYIIAKVKESAAFEYGNRTYTEIDAVAEFDGRFGASEWGLDTRYVNATTKDGLDEVVKDWAEGHYGELVTFEGTGIHRM